MDLQQRKLNKSEWDSIEIPVSQSEIAILNLIKNGYQDVNIRVNHHDSIFTFLKIEYSTKMEDYLYNKYLREHVDKIEKYIKKNDDKYKCISVETDVQIKSADKIRLERNDEKNMKKNDIYEFVLLNQLEKLISYKNSSSKKEFLFHYYTLYYLIKNNVSKVNRHILSLSKLILDKFADCIDMSVIIENAVDFIEKNESLLKYADLTLYGHQKEIFTVCKNPRSKLILYMAPTGTGKTLTPIALSEQYKIIFVCAARHVGLALARAAISIHKKIAFAFGCASAADIRLHYFAAKEYSINKRTGGIGKVDNSIGDDVEIMICDIKSFMPAMYYMKAFNPVENMLVYWDEPTITLDYETHEFHSIIRKNWKENEIPNMVLSSATLPKIHELIHTTADFKNKFADAEIYNIVSHDCKKSIPIINKDGFVVLPHYLDEDYDNVMKIAKHCENYMTILRYFDLKEVVEFISYINKNNYASLKVRIDRYFESLDEINMQNIKIYYIKILQNIIRGVWGAVYLDFKMKRKARILNNETVDVKGNKMMKTTSLGPGTTYTTNLNNNFSGKPLSRLASEQVTIPTKEEKLGTSGVYVTTKDAYTLTDGPTIFITNDVEKIAKFCIQQANIPVAVMDDLMKKIEFNNVLNTKLSELENNLEFIKEQAERNMKNNVFGAHGNVKVAGRNKSSKDVKIFNREPLNGEDGANKGEISKITNEINTIRTMIKSVVLNDTFVPNKTYHVKKWAEGLDTKNVFTSDIQEHIVNEIMLLNGIEDSWKILLMMGIGVFINHKNIAYTEIMKKMADEQKLYMIIASSDYIYGTNYQFCHGFLSKDLDLTQEKIIQAMGRIGRNNIQQNYTIRFRDDAQILKLFTSETDKPEIINMNILFNSNKMVWKDNEYIQIEEPDEEDEFLEPETN